MLDFQTMLAYENGELDFDQQVRFFAHLVATGLAWTLQGHYGRTAAALIDGGYIDRNGAVL